MLKDRGIIRIGVIGAGRWGPNLIRNFYSDNNSRVTVIVEKLLERHQQLLEKFPTAKISENEDDVLLNSNIDAVVIATPTITHYALAKKALENNKHVFVEKPLADNSQRCQELIELAAKKNRTLFVGHVFVYNAGIQSVKNILDSGELGKIYNIQIARTNLGPIRTDVNALWDLGSHDLSILQYWLGEMPQKVSAVGGCFLNKKVEDTVYATYRFSNNTLVNLHVSWLSPKKVREITIVGEHKMLVWDDMNLDKPVQIYNKKVVVEQADAPPKEVVDTFMAFRASIQEGDTIIPQVKLNEPLKAECVAFLDTIHNPRTSLSTGQHGKWVVQALEATDESMRQAGKEVSILY